MEEKLFVFIQYLWSKRSKMIRDGSLQKLADYVLRDVTRDMTCPGGIMYHNGDRYQTHYVNRDKVNVATTEYYISVNQPVFSEYVLQLELHQMYVCQYPSDKPLSELIADLINVNVRLCVVDRVYYNGYEFNYDVVTETIQFKSMLKPENIAHGLLHCEYQFNPEFTIVKYLEIIDGTICKDGHVHYFGNTLWKEVIVSYI